MQPMGSLSASPAPRRALEAPVILGLSVLLSLLVAYAPYGHLLGYPLVLLSTLAHEAGHGLVAALLGGRFDSLELWADGSGLAHTSGELGRLASAAVSAGGLVGPACAAALAFSLARGPRRARAAVLLAGAGLLVADLVLVRTLFGLLFVGAFAALLLALALRGQGDQAQLALGFLAVQLSLSVFSRGDYLFTEVAHTGGGAIPSDTAAMAQALLLPYWFWGLVCGAFSLLVLLLGGYALLRPGRSAADRMRVGQAPTR